MPTYIFDDELGDQRPGSNSSPVLYLPGSKARQWDPVGGTCPQCTLNTNDALPIPLDPSLAQNHTWHTVTVNPEEPPTNLSVTFIGEPMSLIESILMSMEPFISTVRYRYKCVLYVTADIRLRYHFSDEHDI